MKHSYSSNDCIFIVTKYDTGCRDASGRNREFPTTRKIPLIRVSSYHQEGTRIWGNFLPLGRYPIFGYFRPLGRYPISGYLPSGRKFPIPTTRKIPLIWVSSYHQEGTRIRGIFLPLGRYPIFGYLPSGWNREFPTTRKIPGYGVSSQWSEYPIIGYLPSGRKIPRIRVTSQWQEDTRKQGIFLVVGSYPFPCDDYSLKFLC